MKTYVFHVRIQVEAAEQSIHRHVANECPDLAPSEQREIARHRHAAVSLFFEQEEIARQHYAELYRQHAEEEIAHQHFAELYRQQHAEEEILVVTIADSIGEQQPRGVRGRLEEEASVSGHEPRLQMGLRGWEQVRAHKRSIYSQVAEEYPDLPLFEQGEIAHQRYEAAVLDFDVDRDRAIAATIADLEDEYVACFLGATPQELDEDDRQAIATKQLEREYYLAIVTELGDMPELWPRGISRYHIVVATTLIVRRDLSDPAQYIALRMLEEIEETNDNGQR